MKWLFFKLAFFYPRIYAFFCNLRKKDHKREYEEKVKLFYSTDSDPKKTRKIVRGIFEMRGSRKVERYIIPFLDQHFIRWFVTVEGLDILDHALTTKKGVILMSAHMGNFYFGFTILRKLGYEITLLRGGSPKKTRSTKFRYVDPPEHTIFTHNTPLADAAKERISAILGSGGIIYYTPDSVGGRKKVEVSLLGKTMDFPTGVLFFASQTNAVILPFIHLYWRGNIRLIIHKPIDGDWKDGENYQRIMQEFAKILESYILVYPEQYMGIYGPNVLNSYYRSYKMLQR
jgi:KDO2-lipid IV(A) lauroyltransferase